MSHHGREYEDDRVEYVRDTPEQSLETAMKALGATAMTSCTKVHVECSVNGVAFSAVGKTKLEALTELITKVAASKHVMPRTSSAGAATKRLTQG